MQRQYVNMSKLKQEIPIERLFEENNHFSLFQKILLITDGTVTDLLRLYTGKKICVKKLSQEILLSDDKLQQLYGKDTPVLEREILLGTDENNYIYADSFFIFEHMSKAIQYQLLETDKPIGLLWKDEGLNTFREIITVCVEVPSNLNEHFGVPAGTPFLSRTYKIYNNQNLLGIITEKFPITYFEETCSRKT